MIRKGLMALIAVLIGGLTAAGAWAQDRDAPRGEAGQFDYWVLSLSWSPAYCAGARNPDRLQCGEGRRFAFIVHGLWPQYQDGGWPQFCEANRRQPDVPPAIVKEILPIMPSTELIEHEWDKHGTCSGLDPDAYFRRIEDVFARITVPDRFQAPEDAFKISVADLEQDFAAANPGLTGDGMGVVCRNRFLGELRICLDKDFAFKPCGKDVRDTCRGDATVRPVR